MIMLMNLLFEFIILLMYIFILDTFSYFQCTQFRKMINLVHLDLSYNKIHMVMDKAFYNLNRLTHLDLSYNPMKNMSGQVFDTLLGNLCHLNLASIGKIDPSEYHLAKLVSFNISDNEWVAFFYISP